MTALQRGWSKKLSHIPIVYGVSLMWAAERIREGRVYMYKEAALEMLADPMTKLTDSNVFERRGVLFNAGDVSVGV